MKRSEFKKRMQSLKSYREQNPDKGYWDWRASLPDNLRYTDDNEYDMRSAYESGAEPKLEDDGLYHLPTRDPYTGKILKKSVHPTYFKGLTVDSELGYKPYFFGSETYTWNVQDGAFVPWQKVEQFQDGGKKDNSPRMKEIVQYQDNARVGAATQLPEIPTNIVRRNEPLSAGLLDYAPVVGDAVEVANIVHDVKEGNYKDAAIGLGLLAVPGAVTSKIAKIIKSKYGKQGLVRSIYNNVAPGSYYASYIPGGTKKTEIKNALKDYLTGKGDKINPKWADWFRNEDVIGSFIAKNASNKERVKDIIQEARQEAWMNYLGIPHEDKYLINTGAIENGMPVYRSNLTSVPNEQLQVLSDRTTFKKPNNQFTSGDYINSTGGNVGVSYQDAGNLRNITIEDVWDLNPFKDANRARILPDFIRNRYSHIEVQPDGYKKRVWNQNAPKWLVNLEPSTVIGTPGPFLNRTNFTAKILDKNQYLRTRQMSKQEFIDHGLDVEMNVVEFDDADDFQKWRKNTVKRYGELYDKLKNENSIKLNVTENIPDVMLLEKYGPFVKKYFNGGEVPPSDYQGSNEPVNVNPFTRKPLANGSITPVLDLEDASEFTPIGDVLSIRDAYIAARNKDLLGLGLAGLGVIPFIPTVNRKAAQDLMDKAIRQSEKSKQVVDDFYTQRNNVYESMIENEDAFRRAAEADRLAGTDYVGVYGQNIRDYLRDPSIYNDNLPTMRFDGDLYNTNIKMQVDPRNPEYITVNPRYKDPDELDDAFKRINPGLVRHEMGHQTDLKAGLQYTDRLADPSKFVSDEKLKEMFPKTHTKLKSTVLNKGSEIKSYMNEFREFLIGERQWEPKESVKSFRRKLDEYSKQFPTLRMIFDSYKSKSDFVRDYNMVPLTDAGTNQNLV